MSWYYNSSTGEIAEFTGWQKWLEDREITLEKATSTQTHYGPFASQADAQAYKTAHPSVVDRAKQAATGAVTDVTSAITGATNTFVKLSIRVLEAAVGIVLLAVAFNAILKQTTGVDAIGAARKAGTKAAVTAAVV